MDKETVCIRRKDLRKFALTLLDDENGIKEEAYINLIPILESAGFEDIMSMTDTQDNRTYIGEDFAEKQLDELG